MSRRTGSLDGDDARARLYDVMRSGGTLEERLERALEIGTTYFGVDHGYLTEIDRDSGSWEAVLSTDGADGVIPEGLHLDLETTFCMRTIQDEGVLAMEDVLEYGWEGDPAYENSGLRCYHGAPVVVDEELFGTVCFSSLDSRAEPFTESEKSFTHLVAQMVGYEMEQERYEEELAERERELDERREIYRSVIDASFDLVFRMDVEGRFTYVSPPVEELVGSPPEAFVGEPFTRMLPDEETAELGRELFEQVLSGRTVQHEYFPLGTEAGERVYVDVRVTPIYRGDVPPDERTAADIVGAQGMARNATDRRRRERLIGVLNRVLRHNLRNDLNVVGGFADVLRGRLDGEDATLAGRIVEVSDRLVDLSETARKLEENLERPATLEPMDVVPVVDRASSQVAKRYPDASVTVDLPDSAVARTAPRLETAVSELLENAAKHAGEEPSVGVSVATDGDHVLVRVSDDGPGLPEQERSVLTAGEETPLVHGSGLGLWLVHWLVTSLNGTVSTVDSGEGASIEIRLPGASASAESADITAANPGD